MKQERQHKKIIATLLLGMYLFLSLFAQNFHNHSSAEFFKDFQFKGEKNCISKGEFKQEFSDCLSCYLLQHGNTLLPEEFNYQLTQINFLKLDFKGIYNFYYFQNSASVSLRGPPSNFKI